MSKSSHLSLFLLLHTFDLAFCFFVIGFYSFNKILGLIMIILNMHIMHFSHIYHFFLVSPFSSPMSPFLLAKEDLVHFHDLKKILFNIWEKVCCIYLSSNIQLISIKTWSHFVQLYRCFSRNAIISNFTLLHDWVNIQNFTFPSPIHLLIGSMGI